MRKFLENSIKKKSQSCQFFLFLRILLWKESCGFENQRYNNYTKKFREFMAGKRYITFSLEMILYNWELEQQ